MNECICSQIGEFPRSVTLKPIENRKIVCAQFGVIYPDMSVNFQVRISVRGLFIEMLNLERNVLCKE